MEERNRPVERQLLRTMSENPALEWNTRAQGREEAGEVGKLLLLPPPPPPPPPRPPPSPPPHQVVLVPLLYNVHLKAVAAPALMYRKVAGAAATDVLVAGHYNTCFHNILEKTEKHFETLNLKSLIFFIFVLFFICNVFCCEL